MLRVGHTFDVSIWETPDIIYNGCNLTNFKMRLEWDKQFYLLSRLGLWANKSDIRTGKISLDDRLFFRNFVEYDLGTVGKKLTRVNR